MKNYLALFSQNSKDVQFASVLADTCNLDCRKFDENQLLPPVTEGEVKLVLAEIAGPKDRLRLERIIQGRVNANQVH